MGLKEARVGVVGGESGGSGRKGGNTDGCWGEGEAAGNLKDKDVPSEDTSHQAELLKAIARP